jgi:SAM-dependent methyltransferase
MTIDYAAHLEITNAPDASGDLAVGRQRAQFMARAGVSSLDAAILEIGPGHGGFLRALASLGYRNVEAIEADKTLAERGAGAGLPMTWRPAEETGAYLESHRDRFDAICCAHVLEHLEKPDQIPFLAAIRSALKPGGVLICEVPNATSPVASLHRYWDWTHKCLFTWTSLKFVLASAGFEMVEVASVPNAAPPGNPVMAIIANWLGGLSRSTYRMHLLAELGRRALEIPVTSAIIASARRPL